MYHKRIILGIEPKYQNGRTAHQNTDNIQMEPLTTVIINVTFNIKCAGTCTVDGINSWKSIYQHHNNPWDKTAYSSIEKKQFIEISSDGHSENGMVVRILIRIPSV